MFTEIQIKNFKSIEDLNLMPGRVTVLIGENGSGKSNILEAIAFAAAAAADKLDNEFLFNRGIRVTEATWMKSAFSKKSDSEDLIKFSFKGDHAEAAFACQILCTFRKEESGRENWNSQIIPADTETEITQGLENYEVAEKADRIFEFLLKSLKPARNSKSALGLKKNICAIYNGKIQAIGNGLARFRHLRS